FLLYVIAGFWVVPPLVKPRLEKELSSQIGRKVTIDEFKLNPLKLSSTITNLTVYENDGEPFAGFKELLIDAELSTIVRWAATVKEIRLTAPFGVIKVLSDKTLNISDILTKFSQTEPDPEEETGLPRAYLARLQVVDGKFSVEDLTGAEPVIQTLSPIGFTLTNLSTFAEGEGAFKFTGVGPLGGNYQLDGQLSVNPIRVQGSYITNDTHLNHIWRHIKDQVSFQIQSGTIATSGNYLVEMIDGELDAKLQQGVFELKDFQLTEKGKDTVLVSIPSFALQGIKADLKAREIVVEQVKTADARIESWLNSDGTFNFQSLFMPDLQKLTETKESGSSEPEPVESRPWHATIRKIEMDNWGAVVEDRTLPKPVRFSVDGLTVSVENLETKKDSLAQIALELKINQAGTVKVIGSAGIDPLTAELEVHSDEIALKDFQPYVDKMANVRIAAGTISSKGRILFEDKEESMHTRLEGGYFELKNLQITEKDKETALVSIPSFAVQGISADLEAREIVVEQVKTADARIESWIAADGTFNFQNLLIADSQKSAETKKSDATEPKPDESSRWQAMIQKIEVDKWGVAIEDRTLPKPARITVDDLTVRIENLANKKNSKAKVALALQINQAGTVNVDGSASIDPLSANLSVLSNKIALKSFQPYIDAAVNAQIASGTTSSKGRIVYKGKQSQPQIRYQGELSLDGVEVKDRIQTEDFINQKQLKASGIVLDIHPNKLQVSDVLIDKTKASITIDQNGTVNVVQAFVPVDKKGENGKENLIERLVNFLILQIEGPMPMNIDLVKIDDFAVDFIDGSIAPPFKTELEITNATVKGLSSDPSARPDFKIDGTIDQTATIKSSGQMNPLNAMQYAKVDFVLKDFQLPPVSPYSGKYAGFKIEDGKLDLEMKYQVDNNSFSGDNKIFVDRMRLGEKTDSPAATNLPVGLAVTLLKGADGRITLQVPVSGDIADPQFDFGQIILSALTGAMTKASSPPPSEDGTESSPHTADTEGSRPSVAAERAMPSTVQDIDDIKAEEVRFIEFGFGLSELSEDAMKKLDGFAKFLNERSDLTLGIEGSADRQMDWGKLSGKQAENQRPDGKDKTATVQQKDLARDQAVDDKRLNMLALTRANTVKNYLVRNGKVAAERLQLKRAKITSTPDKDYGIVEFHLSGQ
ncbi:MAG: DUF748 domain-containing protein, partial [Desulfobacterales bacterium]